MTMPAKNPSRNGDGRPPSAMSIPVNDDVRDVASARAGDHEAFARLFDRHAPVVLSLCLRAGWSRADADDAMQETFIRAHRKLDQLDDPAGLRSWLYAIARRVCSERRRTQRRRQNHEANAMIAHSLNASRADGAARRCERAEALAMLSHAIDQLDERERLAVHLYYLERDAVTAAREALGLSRSGFYKLLARARTNLAAALREVQPSC